MSRALEAAEERRRALRALLAALFVDADEPEYALVRRHERELARTAADLLGYRLEVGATAARLTGPPTRSGVRRPVRIRPSSLTGQRRSVDDWPALSDRAAVLLFCTLAALERAGAQVAIADLARSVAQAAAEAEPPIAVDFDQRHERVAFADGLDLLVAWGVIEHTAGSRESYRRREQDDTEALLTIDHRRLALILRDPAAAADARDLDDLLAEPHRYADSAEGERRARAHRLARRLVEDPTVLLDDLDEDDRTYFVGQRARVEGGVADATGLHVERRAEGSALIVTDRELTDLPFPANTMPKQLALLLCDGLAAQPPGTELSVADLRAAVADLLRRHREHWGRDADDPVVVRQLAEQVGELLRGLGLAAPAHADGLVALAPCARYREPDVRRPREAR